MILFHIIPIIVLENFVYHDNLYGCDFSIWPETFLEGKVQYDFKDVEIIFPFHGVFLVCVSGIIGHIIWTLTSMKLAFYGDPYDRIIAIIENRQSELEELKSLKSS